MLLNHDFTSIIYIYSTLCRLAREAATVDGVPVITPLVHGRGIGGEADARFRAVAEVDVERGQLLDKRRAVTNLEVGTLGTDGGSILWIIQRVRAAEEEDTLVLSIEGRALVRSDEADALVVRSTIVVAAVGISHEDAFFTSHNWNKKREILFYIE